jgi:D-amino-acid dehydrogenase
MVEQGILWMFNRKSPFYVRPSLRWDLVDWGLKFMGSCTQAHVDRSAKPLVDLLLYSEQIFFDWAAAGAMQFELERKGCIMYYQTPKKEKDELEVAKKAEQLGLSVEILDREQARALEPDVLPDVRGGVWFKDDAHIYPNALMQQLPALLEQKGVRIVRNTEVTGFDLEGGNIRAVHARSTDGKQSSETADMVVLAAGSWSAKIAKLAGAYIPIMPGKGYSMTVENPVKKLNNPCILLEAKVALTPWANRLRIGSTMEIGPVNDRILLPRVEGILEAVPKFLTGYKDDPVFLKLADTAELKANPRSKVWFGFRPVSADGMPYIGFARNTKNLIIATGHAMLGLSLGPGTGKVVADLAGGKTPEVDLKAFDANRFV